MQQRKVKISRDSYWVQDNLIETPSDSDDDLEDYDPESDWKPYFEDEQDD